MKLSSFILSHIEEILTGWDAFAQGHAGEHDGMSEAAVRDHAREMLHAIAQQMETAQSGKQQQLKSEGRAPEPQGPESAAVLHGRQRHANDFSLLQVSAEFRALRATVLRLWQPHLGQVDAAAVQEIVRFNEGIDQALAESIIAWSERTGQTREMFLAILGHDLRSPLTTITLAGEIMADPETPPQRIQPVALNVTRAARIMTSLVNDLMGYTSTQLGKGMPHHPEPCDLVLPLRDAITDAGATYPVARFQLHAPQALVGSFDRTRLYQMFLNLLVNAARHGAENHPVVVTAGAIEAGFEIGVGNRGEPIAAASLESIFVPLVQLGTARDIARSRTSLGLGLFIAREIAEAHGGRIGVTSSQAEGTRFVVTLPGLEQGG